MGNPRYVREAIHSSLLSCTMISSNPQALNRSLLIFSDPSLGNATGEASQPVPWGGKV